MRYLFLLVIFITASIGLQARTSTIRTGNTGFYSISQTELIKTNTPVYIGQIHINNSGGEKPFFLQSRKSSFKKDDDLIFFSQMLHGETTYQHPLDDFNGYTLSVGQKTKSYKQWTIKDNTFKNLPICESIKNH